MKTRRRFLAEAGVLLSGLVVPGAAQAWGRRRAQVICPPCPCPAPEYATKLEHATRLLDGLVTCVLPTFCYGNIDGYYSYDGINCDNGLPVATMIECQLSGNPASCTDCKCDENNCADNS